MKSKGGFKDAFISDIAAGASRQAVKQMLKKYRVIYLSRYTNIRMARNALDELEFPDAPVLRWQGEQTLKALKEKGVDLHAIIGPTSVIDTAADHIKKRYTFDQNQKEQTVKDWPEVMKRLSESASKDPQKGKKKE